MILFIPPPSLQISFEINMCYLHGVGVPQAVLVAVVEIMDRYELGEGLEAHVMNMTHGVCWPRMAGVTGHWPPTDTGGPRGSEEGVLSLCDGLSASPAAAPALETRPGLHSEELGITSLHSPFSWSICILFSCAYQREGVQILYYHWRNSQSLWHCLKNFIYNAMRNRIWHQATLIATIVGLKVQHLKRLDRDEYWE